MRRRCDRGERPAMNADAHRVVEIWVPSLARTATGYAIGPRAVLTARHVVGGLDAEPADAVAGGGPQVRPLPPRGAGGGGRWLASRVVWRSGVGVDLALLEVRDEALPVPGLVEWGEVVGDVGNGPGVAVAPR
jgi:hypothetical protein